MSLQKHKPITPGQRGKVSVDRSDLYKGESYAPLLRKQKQNSGRNNAGRITMRHRGGGHKHHYRLVDFKRNKHGIDAKVLRIEYDPNRTAYLALLCYADGEHRYIIAPSGIKPGDIVSSGSGASISPGNCMNFFDMPVGIKVHCIELQPGKGAQLARSAGTHAQFVALDGDYALLRLKSGEVRKVNAQCSAVIGEVSNDEHFLVKYGKAGSIRHKGRRPHVRGMVMNPVDHPMGGGEGRSKSNKDPVSPWNQPAKGHRTRKNKRTSRWIVTSRHARKR